MPTPGQGCLRLHLPILTNTGLCVPRSPGGYAKARGNSSPPCLQGGRGSEAACTCTHAERNPGQQDWLGAHGLWATAQAGRCSPCTSAGRGPSLPCVLADVVQRRDPAGSACTRLVVPTLLHLSCERCLPRGRMPDTQSRCPCNQPAPRPVSEPSQVEQSASWAQPQNWRISEGCWGCLLHSNVVAKLTDTLSLSAHQ